MGKGDKKSKKGKIIAGSYGIKRPRKASSANHIPVKVLDEDDKKASKEKVRKEVGQPTGKSENAEVERKPKAEAKPKAAAKPKAEKKEDPVEAKPKAEKATDGKEAKSK
ncbi:30S ribosomal protein THX [Chryseobacterium sp. SNU WT5]|uniref:30S ribosomal protein THX n=1 Tax=Chryseobacterium sp. SNU WT5 TaxID=2594269 RepID=UPI0039774FF0